MKLLLLLLLLCGAVPDGTRPAGEEMPLVLISQAAVLSAQVGHMLLQLKDARLLPLQQSLLGLDDLSQLFKIADRLRRVLGPFFHSLYAPLNVPFDAL